MTQELDIPVNDYSCVTRYPHLQELYLSPVVLAWGKVPFSLAPLEGKQRYPLNTIQQESDTNAVWIDPIDRTRETSSDVVVHRGECRDFLHYRDSLPLEEVPADKELIIRAFAIEKLRRFSGIATFHTIDKTIYSISLRPCIDMSIYYSDTMIKSFRKYYKSKS